MSSRKKPQAVETAVIVRHMTGSSNTDISKDLGIARKTVIRILKDSQIHEIMEEGKSGLYQIIPDAVTTYSEAVKTNADRAESFLERMKVLPGKQDNANSATINNFIGIGNLPRLDRKPIQLESAPD